MKNYQKLYNRLMREMNEGSDEDQRIPPAPPIRNQGTVPVAPGVQQHKIYNLSDDDIIYIDELDVQYTNLQQRIRNGAQCILKHVALLGKGKYYILDNPTSGRSPTDSTRWTTQQAFVLRGGKNPLPPGEEG